MSRFELCEMAGNCEAQMMPVAFQDELNAEREKLKGSKPGAQSGLEKTAAGEEKSGEQQGERSKAQQIVDQALADIKKELEERKAKNGSLSEKDAQEVLPKYFPKFEEAVKEADTAFDSTRKTAKAEMDKLKPDLEKVVKQMEPHAKKFEEAAKAVPEEKAEAVDEMLAELDDPKLSAKRRGEIKDALAAYPDLFDSYEAMNKIAKDNISLIEKVEGLKNGVQKATYDSFMSRQMYINALSAGGGDQQKLEGLAKEAQMLQLLLILGPDVHFQEPQQQEQKPARPKAIEI
ncbi:MAG TPA: hypothetical protein V6D17_03935 [Candidatus Obscuribacterales bacterium]